ncbi:hypothetical protein NO1_0266 [Candidatus Termititenax aidoneus]|uniref:Uncharacterized protein n=1 Tax=Termititenax aidoneus TaxID=2218524 RepID=A0A388T8U3_TERA1|nr:hypothetical protein NO1_0266 [Candidatus Termititenax aidoneus]
MTDEKTDKLSGGLDSKTEHLTFAEYADRDGWLKALLWTVFGGAFFIALMLATVAFFASDRSSLSLSAYLSFIGLALGLKHVNEKEEEKGQ